MHTYLPKRNFFDVKADRETRLKRLKCNAELHHNIMNALQSSESLRHRKYKSII